MTDLSIVLIVRNGGSALTRALESCEAICSRLAAEIVVIDDFSEDDTLAIAKQFNAKIFQHHLNNDFAEQTNFALQQASGKWVLILDHDEVITPILAGSIAAAIQANPPLDRIYLIKRINCFKHLKLCHGVFRPSWFKRLFPRENAFYTGKVHQTLMHPVTYKTLKLHGDLEHYTISNLPSYWQKQAFYASLFAEKKIDLANGRLSKTKIVFKTIFAFFQSYIGWLGFLDGFWGWYFSLQFATYTANRYSQIYALQHNLGKEL